MVEFSVFGAEKGLADKVTGYHAAHPGFGKKPWNFGLTKETDERVKKKGEKSKARISNPSKAICVEAQQIWAIPDLQKHPYKLHVGRRGMAFKREIDAKKAPQRTPRNQYEVTKFFLVIKASNYSLGKFK